MLKSYSAPSFTLLRAPSLRPVFMWTLCICNWVNSWIHPHVFRTTPQRDREIGSSIGALRQTNECERQMWKRWKREGKIGRKEAMRWLFLLLEMATFWAESQVGFLWLVNIIVCTPRQRNVGVWIQVSRMCFGFVKSFRDALLQETICNSCTLARFSPLVI